MSEAVGLRWVGFLELLARPVSYMYLICEAFLLSIASRIDLLFKQGFRYGNDDDDTQITPPPVTPPQHSKIVPALAKPTEKEAEEIRGLSIFPVLAGTDPQQVPWVYNRNLKKSIHRRGPSCSLLRGLPS